MREILVSAGPRRFKLTIPEDAVISFGPWSPPREGSRQAYDDKVGTLRIYTKDKKDILGCFSGVTSFRDTSRLGYAEEIAKEEVSTVWRDDHDGFYREVRGKREQEWIRDPEPLPAHQG